MLCSVPTVRDRGGGGGGRGVVVVFFSFLIFPSVQLKREEGVIIQTD